MDGWRKRSCNGNRIQALEGGPYKLRFGDDVPCSHLVFMGRADAAVDVDEVRITESFGMKDPYLIQNCMVFKGMSRYRLMDSFAEENGPKALLPLPGKRGCKPQQSVLMGLAEEVKAQVASTTATIQQHFRAESSSYVGETRQRQVTENLRMASMKAQESSKRRRTIALQPAKQ